MIRGELTAKRAGWRIDWLSRYQPIDRVGYGFYIFTFDGPTQQSSSVPSCESRLDPIRLKAWPCPHGG